MLTQQYILATKAQAPAVNIVPSLRGGAPAGITDHIPDMGIFPAKADSWPTATIDHVQAMAQSDSNHKYLEEDSEVGQFVAEMTVKKKSWAKTFRNMRDS